jgi:hypothetical protein
MDPLKHTRIRPNPLARTHNTRHTYAHSHPNHNSPDQSEVQRFFCYSTDNAIALADPELNPEGRIIFLFDVGDFGCAWACRPRAGRSPGAFAFRRRRRVWGEARGCLKRAAGQAQRHAIGGLEGLQLQGPYAGATGVHLLGAVPWSLRFVRTAPQVEELRRHRRQDALQDDPRGRAAGARRGVTGCPASRRQRAEGLRGL